MHLRKCREDRKQRAIDTVIRKAVTVHAVVEQLLDDVGDGGFVSMSITEFIRVWNLGEIYRAGYEDGLATRRKEKHDDTE